MNFTRMLALVLVSVCFAVLPIRAEAVTFTVDSTDDVVDAVPGDGVCATVGSVCTLRAAVQEANALVGADTILLKAKKYYLTIAGIGEDAAATGDLDITDDLTIKGVSSAKTIVNGGALDRVFHITGPFIVKFVNLSLQNGFVQDHGAGVYNAGGTVSLISCSVTNNVSSGSADLRGGGIFSLGGSLSIKSSSVINNAVVSDTSYARGGGIAVVTGTLNISASKIAYNSATTAASQAVGGGIYSSGDGGITITNSKVLANSAISFSNNSYGGGVMLGNGTTAAVIRETNISMNSSTSSGATAVGGGLYFQAEAVTISSCTIKGNRANAAGGGFGGGILANVSSDITINKESTIVKNLASSNGGGIYKDGSSTVTVSPNSIVANNMPNDQN